MRLIGMLAGALVVVAGGAHSARSQITAGTAPAAKAADSDRSAAEPAPPASLWTRTQGEDWPSFLGPRRDGKSPETGILTHWESGVPRIVWKRKVGVGYCIGSVSRGRFFQFDRHGDLARLTCLNAETGEELWRFEYPTDFVDMYGYEGGPRGSPVVEDDRVYIFGAEGMLHCLRVSDGHVLWKCDTPRKFGVIQNFFGVGSTPLVEGDLLIAIMGGSPAEDREIPRDELNRVRGNGTGIVAFDKRTGEVKYELTSELAAYSSPVVATINGRRRCFAFCRGGLVAFDVQAGRVNFRYPWRSKLLESVIASTPVVAGDEVFISEAYGPGSSLLKVLPSGYQIVWRDDPHVRRKALKTQFNTPIYHEGFLYACSGRYVPEMELRCIDWKTGQQMWSQHRGYRCNLLYVDQHLVCLGERGVLQLIKANPRRCEIVSETTLHDGKTNLLEYPCWAAPILSHGLLYLRSKTHIVCLELIPPA